MEKFLLAATREGRSVHHYFLQLSAAPWVKAIFSAISAGAVFLFPDVGAVKDGTMLLMLTMMLDALTGVCASIREHVPVSSSGLYRTAVKILVYFSLVMVAAIVGKMVFSDTSMRKVVISLVLAWAVLTEAISILENITRMGFPLPEFLLKVLKWEKASVEHKGDAFQHRDKE